MQPLPLRLARVAMTALIAASPVVAASDSQMLRPWTGPYGGVPPFDQVKVDEFGPAFEVAMAEQLAEIDAIAANPAAPTFDNTIAALERSGRTLDRAADPVRRLREHDEHPRRAGRRARDRAQARRVRRQDHAERGALRARRGGLRRARDERADARAAAPRLARLHQLRARRRPARQRREGAACRRSTSAWRPSTPSSRRTSSPTRPTTSWRSKAPPTSTGLPSRCAPAPPPRPRREARRASG